MIEVTTERDNVISRCSLLESEVKLLLSNLSDLKNIHDNFLCEGKTKEATLNTEIKVLIDKNDKLTIELENCVSRAEYQILISQNNLLTSDARNLVAQIDEICMMSDEEKIQFLGIRRNFELRMIELTQREQILQGQVFTVERQLDDFLKKYSSLEQTNAELSEFLRLSELKFMQEKKYFETESEIYKSASIELMSLKEELSNSESIGVVLNKRVDDLLFQVSSLQSELENSRFEVLNLKMQKENIVR